MTPAPKLAALCLLFFAPAARSAVLFSTASLDASGNTGHGACAAIDRLGALHAAYYDAAGGNVLYRKRTAGVWSAAQIVAAANNQPHLSLALGTDAAIHLAFYSNAAPCAGLCHAASSGGAWTLSSVDNAVDRFYASIAVDGAGLPHVAYAGLAGALKYARFTGAAWTSQSVDASADVVPDQSGEENTMRQLSLALDGAGKPRIAYVNAGLGALLYVESDGAAWGAAETAVDDPGGLKTGVSLSLDGSGAPRVSFLNYAQEALYYAAKAGGLWSAEQVDPAATAPDPFFSSSLALDGAGKPAIAFHDNNGPEGTPAAGLARFDGVSWTTHTIDGGFSAEFMSLAIDAAGDPHALYSDFSSGAPQLRYASATAAGFAPPLGGGAGGKVQAPANFTQTAVYFSSIAWSWSDNSSNETGFRLYGAGTSTGPFSLVASINAGQTSYTETGLTFGTTYFRYIAAVNAGGVAVSSGAAARTLSVSTASQSASGGDTVVYAAPTGPVSVTIPAGAFPGAVTLAFSVPASFPTATAVAAKLSATGVGVEITPNTSAQPAVEAVITVAYPDFNVLGLDENKLILARFDSSKNTWVALNSTADPAGNLVTARTNHFSLFQVMQASPATVISEAKAFPNPLRPARGHVRMTFSPLPEAARIRIYTFAGELVKDISATAVGAAVWDGTNSNGEKAASGVYFALVQSGGESRTIKVAVQR